MNETYRKALYSQAKEKWGVNNQMDMVIEECAELIQAINKFKRNRTDLTLKYLFGEIADVEIMVEQLKEILQNNQAINDIKNEKLKRLEQRIINANSTH